MKYSYVSTILLVLALFFVQKIEAGTISACTCCSTISSYHTRLVCSQSGVTFMNMCGLQCQDQVYANDGFCSGGSTIILGCPRVSLFSGVHSAFNTIGAGLNQGIPLVLSFFTNGLANAVNSLGSTVGSTAANLVSGVAAPVSNGLSAVGLGSASTLLSSLSTGSGQGLNVALSNLANILLGAGPGLDSNLNIVANGFQ